MLFKDLISRIEKFDVFDEGTKVVLDESLFLEVLRTALKGVRVDREWYLSQYEDVEKAMRAGEIASAREHFATCGYFEGRLPFRIEIDDEFYRQENPDVAEAIDCGLIKSCEDHFLNYGASEGRYPSEGFSFFRCQREAEES